MKRTPLRSRRHTPRRREGPRWEAADWQPALMRILARSGYRCECCGTDLGPGVEVHHRVRRRDGGDRLSNLLALTPTCHRRWTTNPAEAKARGIIVPPWADPADVPVLHRGTAWSALDDDGGLTELGANHLWRIV